MLPLNSVIWRQFPNASNNSKSVGSDTVRVRPPPSAPYSTNPNLMPIGDGFGFVDENLTAKFEKDFEAPGKNEIDFFAEKL